jgi:RHS repeat-associated protein
VIADAIKVVSDNSAARIGNIHTDHLGTPRLIEDQSGKTVWRWDHLDPFGANPANEDPDGDGVKVVFNLRVPGQVFDKESGTHYNYFRDYDRSTGRYIQSDPIGLAGGINTYAYVGENPLSYADPTGLQAGAASKLIGDAFKELMDTIFGMSVGQAAEEKGEKIGEGLQGNTGSYGCPTRCNEACLKLLDRTDVYSRNEILFSCIKGCVRKCGCQPGSACCQ